MTAFHPYTQRRKRHYRKRTLSTRLRIGNFSLSIALIGLICILSIAQVMHANSIQTKGYEIRALEEERQDLMSINKELRFKVTEAQSLAAIKDSQVVDNMELVVDPIILTVENEFAVK